MSYIGNPTTEDADGLKSLTKDVNLEVLLIQILDKLNKIEIHLQLITDEENVL